MSDLPRRAAAALLLSLLGCSDGPGGLPDASRDRIVFSSRASGNYDIYVMDQDGSNRAQLTATPLEEAEPTPSPDGTRMAFVSFDGGVGVGSIHVMNIDGSGAIQLTGLPGQFPGFATDPSWSPDGTRVLFTSFPNGLADQFVMNADGTGWVNLTDDELVRDEYGTWSPNGLQIAFVRWIGVGGSHPYIHVMNADGSNVRQVTSGDWYDLYPAWSPDSRQIVFARFTAGGPTGQIFMVSSTGTGLRPLTGGEGVDGQPSWSRDGKRLLFTRSPVANVEADIWIGRADGSQAVNLTQSPPVSDLDPQWLPVP